MKPSQPKACEIQQANNTQPQKKDQIRVYQQRKSSKQQRANRHKAARARVGTSIVLPAATSSLDFKVCSYQV
jgi:hypothetical protein